MAWGWHLIVNARGCGVEKVRSAENITGFVKDLVAQIDMTAYGEPMLQHFGNGHLTGYTLVQLIETSNICAHFCDDNGDAYFDVFSCKEFDPKVASEVIKKWFQPEAVQETFLTRDARDMS